MKIIAKSPRRLLPESTKFESSKVQQKSRLRNDVFKTAPDDRSAGRAEELDAVFAAVARYFSLLAEPTRLKILHAICQAEQPVSAIVEHTGASQTNVSRHLALLHQAGVVARRKEGNAVHYRVADPEFVAICRTVCVQIAGRIDAGTPLREELLDFASRH